MSSGELDRVEVMGRVGSGDLKHGQWGGDAGVKLSTDEKVVAAVSAGGQ